MEVERRQARWNNWNTAKAVTRNAVDGRMKRRAMIDDDDDDNDDDNDDDDDD